jgi:hypothetical protein
MTFAAVALLGMTAGQPPGPESYTLNQRAISLPIKYNPKQNRKDIRAVQLYMAKNRENTWYLEGSVTPDKDVIPFTAKEDGIYWFKMVIVDLKGKRDVVELTRDPPDMQVVIDTTPPVVRVTKAKRTGRNVVIEWAVEDKFPSDAQTRVYFCVPGPQARWQPVQRDPSVFPPGTPWYGVGFDCGTTEAIAVNISTADIAGNPGEFTQHLPAAEAQTTTALAPPGAADTATPAPATAPPAGSGIVPVQGNSGAGAVVNPSSPGVIEPPAAPPSANPSVVAAPPTVPPNTPPFVPAQTPPSYAPPAAGAPGFTQPLTTVDPKAPPTGYSPPGSPPAPNPAAGTPGLAQPLPTVDPKAPPTGYQPSGGPPAPAGGWGGAAPAAPEALPAQVIKHPRFDIAFDLEKCGASGIRHVGLWVTRDDGRTWRHWNNFEGKGGAVRVALDIPQNPQVEGTYGFRLVPVSNAGLSEGAPTAGDAPDLRVVLDVTPPDLQLGLLPLNPNAPDTVVIEWVATDKNLGTNPVTLEWGESATGPWQPVVAAGTDSVIQAGAGTTGPKALAGSGQYAWRVPAGTPPRVYLRATARDAAGNVAERVTKDPISVDPVKPRAKIHGIVTPQSP